MGPSAPVILLAGCAIDRGTSPYRHLDPSYTRLEDLESPGGVFSLTPVSPNRILCPHCEAVNQLGETRCRACGKRLSLAPQWVPCATCSQKGKLENGSECPACGGRGFVKVEEPDGVDLHGPRTPGP
jgi:DNA-directed RNA polymerase subunit RPC12/RpoP